ncbi:MAG: hypothetical protein ACE5M4_09820 [Anaerolineales bacterium]
MVRAEVSVVINRPVEGVFASVSGDVTDLTEIKGPFDLVVYDGCQDAPHGGPKGELE